MNDQDGRHSLSGPYQRWRDVRECQIAFLKSAGLEPTHKFLDIGCGTLRGGIPIVRYLNSKNYYGIDVRKNVIECAQEELKYTNLEHKKPNLIHFSDFNNLIIKDSFNIMWAFSVIWHLEQEDIEKCFKFIKNNLTNDGVFYANAGITTKEDGPVGPTWFGFNCNFRSIGFYDKLASDNGLLMNNLGPLVKMGFGKYRKSSSLMEAHHPMLKFVKKI